MLFPCAAETAELQCNVGRSDKSWIWSLQPHFVQLKNGINLCKEASQSFADKEKAHKTIHSIRKRLSKRGSAVLLYIYFLHYYRGRVEYEFALDITCLGR